MVVIVPPLREQEAIAEMLGSLDSKLESNDRVSRNLDAACTAVYERFAYEAQESVAIAEIVSFNPPVPLNRGTVYPFVEMAAVDSWRPVPAPSHKAYSGSGARFEVGDTLMARITPSLEHGKTAYIGPLDPATAGFGSTEFIVARARPGGSSAAVFYLLRTDLVRDHAIANMTGSSGRQRVPVDCFEGFEVPKLRSEHEGQFDALASQCLSKMYQLHHESDGLREVRDVLLPKLISGELRIPDAEKLVEKAL